LDRVAGPDAASLSLISAFYFACHSFTPAAGDLHSLRNIALFGALLLLPVARFVNGNTTSSFVSKSYAKSHLTREICPFEGNVSH
jgi:hypothetical protein